jgi:hypothetical protein
MLSQSTQLSQYTPTDKFLANALILPLKDVLNLPEVVCSFYYINNPIYIVLLLNLFLYVYVGPDLCHCGQNPENCPYTLWLVLQVM